MADVLKERGLFWWGDTKVPPTQFAPQESVAGVLTISDHGRIEIELDGVMPGASGPIGALSRGALPPDRTIAGLLKSNDRRILASTLHHVGSRWSSNGISFDKFIAQTCLVARQSLPKSPKVRSVSFDLSGFGEWLRLGLKITRTSRSIGLRYRQAPDLRYIGERAAVVISKYLIANTRGALGSGGVDFREVASLRFTPARSQDVPTAIQTFGYIQDLMILLTGSEYQTDWPTLTLTTGRESTAYFFRNLSNTNPPDYFDCVTSFPEIKDHFGDIFFRWLRKREELGPGAYLYMSTRRGMNVYEEQKFNNLVSGLEALHRSLTGDPVSAAFEEKMNRILADINSEGDRNWLRKRTRGFGAPSLEQRLSEILREIPAAGLDAAKIRGFCADTAKMRNVLAHGGHPEQTAGSTSSIQQLAARNSILSYLYHARILLEIGIPREVVDRWLNHSRDTYGLNWSMVQVGLKPTSVLRPKKL